MHSVGGLEACIAISEGLVGAAGSTSRACDAGLPTVSDLEDLGFTGIEV